MTQNLDASLEPCRCSGNLRQVTVYPKSLVHFHYIGNEREGELGVTNNTNIGGPHGTFSSEDGLTSGIDERFQRRVFVPRSFEAHVKVLGPGHSRREWDHLAPVKEGCIYLGCSGSTSTTTSSFERDDDLSLASSLSPRADGGRRQFSSSSRALVGV